MSRETTPGRPLRPRTRVQTLTVALAAVTGLVHLYLVYEERGDPLEALVFLGAALGFFAGIYLLLRYPTWRLLYLVGILFTGVQIPLWVLGGMDEFPLGVADKVVHVVLVFLLAYTYAELGDGPVRGRPVRED